MKKPNEAVLDASVNQIINFLDQNQSLSYKLVDYSLYVQQEEDKKTIKIDLQQVEKVLSRVDYDGSEFIQVNFNSQVKLLMTKNLIGFKPVEVIGFDSGKIPKVVTTVDLKSISKAIEDLYDGDESFQTLTELEVLKKVFHSILIGAEAVGFEMRQEKEWFARYLLNHSAASA